VDETVSICSLATPIIHANTYGHASQLVHPLSNISTYCIGMWLTVYIYSNVCNCLPPFPCCSYVVMINFASQTLGKPFSAVKGRVLLASADVFAIMFAVGGAYGLATYMGVAFSSVAQVCISISLSEHIFMYPSVHIRIHANMCACINVYACAQLRSNFHTGYVQAYILT
jgi:hypothetical protein